MLYKITTLPFYVNSRFDKIFQTVQCYNDYIYIHVYWLFFNNKLLFATVINGCFVNKVPEI